MPFLYETHMHTCQASACGVSTGREHARFYKELGYQGIIITDHFFGGNTCVPRDLPWKERIEMFCSGYEDALAEGQKIGLDVFFGWEQGYGDDEYLIYGLDKNWLLAHPEVEHWSRKEQFEGIHRYGGCVIQAHPLRTRSYIHYVRLATNYCDGIEAANGANGIHNNAYALKYGQEYGFPMTAGSDNHNSAIVTDPDKQIFGISLEEKLTSIQDLVRIILNREPKITLRVPEGHFNVNPDEVPVVESFFIDENEELVPTGRDWLRD